MGIKATDWNRAVASTQQRLIIRDSTVARPSNKYVSVYNPSEETKIEVFTGVWFGWDPDVLEETDLNNAVPVYRVIEGLKYTQVFGINERAKFPQMGVAQEPIKPGAVGRVQVDGVTVARTYAYRIVDHTRHYFTGLGYISDDYPFAGLRPDGVFDPYEDSPVSALLIGRNVVEETTIAGKLELEEDPEKLIYDYGIISFPLVLAR